MSVDESKSAESKEHDTRMELIFGQPDPGKVALCDYCNDTVEYRCMDCCLLVCSECTTTRNVLPMLHPFWARCKGCYHPTSSARLRMRIQELVKENERLKTRWEMRPEGEKVVEMVENLNLKEDKD